MRTCDEEMTMTANTYISKERISPLSIYYASVIIRFLQNEPNVWTYAFNITSDSVPQWEETQS